MASRILIRPDGAKVDVPEENVMDAVAAGYRAESSAEVSKRQAGEEPGRAALEGVARGLTMGLSDPFLKGAGADPTAMGLRRQENPLAAGAGEVGGIVAGTLLSKKIPTPIGLVGEAGAAASEATALATGSKLLGRAAGGGFEGSLFGLGQAITEDAIEDKPLTGEKLLASLGGGAIAGAGASVAFGSIGDVGTSVLNKALGGKALREQLGDLSDRVYMRQIAKGSDLKKDYLLNRTEDIVDFGKAEGILHAGTTTTSGAEKAAEVLKKESDSLGAVLQTVDANSAGFDSARAYVAVKKVLEDKAGKDPILNKGKEQVLALFKAGPGGMHGAPAPGLMDTPGVRFKDAWSLNASMRKLVGHGEELSMHKDLVWKARQALRDQIFEQADEVAPHLGKTLREASDRYGNAAALEGLFSKRLAEEAGNRGFGLTDNIWGAGIAGAVGSAGGPLGVVAGGAIGAAGNKVLRQRGPYLLAAAADSLSKSRILDNAGKGLKKLIEDKLGIAGDIAAPWRLALENAAASGGVALVEQHLNFAQHDPNYMPSLGFNHEDAETAQAAVLRGTAIANMQDAAAAFDSQIDRSVGRFVGAQGGPKPSYEHPAPEEFDDRVAELEKMVNDQNYLMQRLPQNLIGVAPGIGQAVLETSQRAAEFLYSKAPKPPSVQMPALRQPWSAPEGDVNSWLRYVAAVENPLQVLEQMSADGGVAPEAVQALQTVYPRLYEEFRQRTMKRLAEMQDPIEYEKKIALQALFGEDLGGVAGQTALLQQVHTQAQQREEAPPSQDGRQKVSQEDNMQTQGQRLEQRGQK